MSDLTWPADRMAKILDISTRRLNQLVGLGVLSREERGRYDPIKTTVTYIRYLRDRKSPDAEKGIESESQTRQGLNKERELQLKLQNETLRKQRIPLAVVRRIDTTAYTNIAQLIRARRGKVLDDHTLNDVFSEIQRAADELARVVGGEEATAAGIPEIEGIPIARGRGRPRKEAA